MTGNYALEPKIIEEVEVVKSEWRVTRNYIDGASLYAVYRLIDVDKVDHSGNREFAGGYTTNKKAAIEVANILNKEEAKI